MKRTLLAAAGGLGAAALLAPAASAQVYAGAGATIFTAEASGEDVALGAILGRAGFKANTFFGVEGEFAIEAKDRLAIDDPQGVFLDKGGRIFIAERDGEPVGCCAMVPSGSSGWLMNSASGCRSTTMAVCAS